MADQPFIACDRIKVADGTFATRLTLNRPEVLNPIDWETLAELDGHLDAIERDTETRAVLVTGSGRAFSAGGDMKRYQSLQRDPVEFPRFVADFHRVLGRFRSLALPVVALVNGVTAAGGLELVLACDFAIAARSARIGDAHMNFGQMGGGGVLTLLPRLIGLPKATELIFSGRFLDADEAVEWNIVSRVVDDDALLEAGLAFAREVAAKSPLAIANAKSVMTRIWADGMTLGAGLELERITDTYYCLTSSDAPEGLQAFVDKRAPRFEGR